jgi:hypothetical protein
MQQNGDGANHEESDQARNQKGQRSGGERDESQFPVILNTHPEETIQLVHADIPQSEARGARRVCSLLIPLLAQNVIRICGSSFRIRSSSASLVIEYSAKAGGRFCWSVALTP